QRIIAPHLLAVEGCSKRQMLPGLEREPVAQLGRNFKANRIRLARFGHDFRDPKRVEMLGHASSLPACVWIGARQELHDREQMSEMFAVVPAPAAEDRTLVRRYIELRFSEDARYRRAILALELARVGRD